MSYTSDDFLTEHPDAEERGALVDKLWPVFVFATKLVAPPMMPWPPAPDEPPRWRVFRHRAWVHEMREHRARNYGPFNVSPNNEITLSHIMCMKEAVQYVEEFLDHDDEEAHG